MFFKNFPQVDYFFGNEITTVKYQQNNIYVDIIDQVKNDRVYYTLYEVLENERPDVLSQKLYGTPIHYWTFFLVNDTLREQGWPLTQSEVEKQAKKAHPDKVITSRSNLVGTFEIGSTITGLTSGETAIIKDRRLDLGQLFVDSDKEFIDGELISVTVNDVITTTTIANITDGYLSAFYYEDSNLARVDVDPFSSPPGIYNEVTILDHYQRSNDELKSIKVLKPNAVEQINAAFQRLVAQ